jgi:hypothetical protein
MLAVNSVFLGGKLVSFYLPFYIIDDISHRNNIYGVKGLLNVKTALNLITKEKWSNDLVAFFNHQLTANSDLLCQLIINICSGQFNEDNSISLLQFLPLLTFDHQPLPSLPEKIGEVFSECESPLVKIALFDFVQNSLPKHSFYVHSLFITLIKLFA